MSYMHEATIVKIDSDASFIAYSQKMHKSINATTS